MDQRELVSIPDNFDELEEDVQIKFVEENWLDASAQEILAEEGGVGVRKALARNPSLSEDWQEYLYITGDDDVKQALAANSALAIDLLEKMISEKDWRIRAAVAKNSNIKIDFIDELLDDEDEDVLASLATNLSLDACQQEELFDKGRAVKVALAGHPNLLEKLEIRLCEENDSDVMQRLAGRDGISLAAQTHIINSIPIGWESPILEELAKNKALKIVYIRKLAEGACLNTRLSLLENPSLRDKERDIIVHGLSEDDLSSLERSYKWEEAKLDSVEVEAKKAFQEYLDYNPDKLFCSYEKQDQLLNVHLRYKEEEQEILEKMKNMENRINLFKAVCELGS